MRVQLAVITGLLLLATGVSHAAEGDRKILPVFGLSIVPPTGWKEQLPEQLNEVIAWQEPAKGDGKTLAGITIRCEPVKGDLAANATEMAGRYRGAVLDEVAAVDGEAAKVIWVNRPGVDAEVRAVVAQHGGLTYSFECSGPVGLPRPVFDAFVKDVKWSKLEAIADHLKGDGPWMNALGGQLKLQGPEILRPAVPEAMQKADRFIMLTPRAKVADAEFVCVLFWGQAIDTRTFAEISKGYLASLNSQQKTAEIKWVGNDPNKKLSNLVGILKKDPTGGIHVVNTIAGIAKIEGLSQYVVMNCIVNTDDPAKQKAYEEVAKRIFDSIKAAK